MKRIFSGVAMEQDPTGGSSPPPPPLGPPGGLTGTGGWTGPQVLGGPPEALNLRFSRKPCMGSPESPGVPQRPRGGGVREKDPGPPEGPEGPQVPGVRGYFASCPRRAQTGSHVPGQQDPEPPRDPSPGGLWCRGAGGPFPSRPWRPSRAPEALRDRRGDGEQLVRHN